MKKFAAILMTLVMTLMIGIGVASEATPFSLDGTYSWGMTEAEVLSALGNIRIEKEVKQKLTYLDPDDHRFVYEGLSSEITFGLSEGKLVLIKLDFDDPVSSQAVKDVLTAQYGEGQAVANVADLADLENMSDEDEIELRDDDPQTFCRWAAADGTQIVMITETKDDDAKAVFYTVTK